MQEGLSPEHAGELFSNSLEHFLNGSGVSNESDSHLESFGRDITDRALHVVGDPFYEVRRVLVLDVEHLFIDFLGAHSSSEHGSSSQISSMSGISSTHHVLSIEHLLSQFRHSQGSVLLGSSGSQRSESNHKEMQSGERHQIDSQLSKITVQLSRESQAASHSTHGNRDQMVQVSISRGSQLQGPETDVVEGFIVYDHSFI